MVLNVLSLHCPQDTEETMPCPLCGIVLPQSALIIHAGSCVGTSDTLQSLVQVPIQVQPDAFARKNDTQLNNDGILLTQQGCIDMALFNRDGCNEDHGGHHVHVGNTLLRVHILTSIASGVGGVIVICISCIL